MGISIIADIWKVKGLEGTVYGFFVQFWEVTHSSKKCKGPSPSSHYDPKGNIMEVFIFLLAVNLQKFDFVISFYVLLDKR